MFDLAEVNYSESMIAQVEACFKPATMQLAEVLEILAAARALSSPRLQQPHDLLSLCFPSVPAWRATFALIAAW